MPQENKKFDTDIAVLKKEVITPETIQLYS